jgi:hypothetical protein
MSIEWKINGRGVPPGSVGRELVKSMRAEIEANVRREVIRHRCNVHGEQAKLTLRERGGEISFEINGCCDEFVQQVYKALQ